MIWEETLGITMNKISSEDTFGIDVRQSCPDEAFNSKRTHTVLNKQFKR